MHDFLNEPNPVVAFLRLDEHYRLSGPSERSAIREGWDFGRRWHIPGLDYSNWERIVFAPLTGEDAYGLNAEARIEVRLTYHAIENARSDFRDNFLDLCLCYHCALRADLDVVQLFEEAAEVSDKKMAGYMRGFLGRDRENKSLWAFGFREVVLDNGLAFESIALAKDYMLLKPSHFDEWGRAENA